MADASRAAARVRPGAISMRKQVKSNQQTPSHTASKASAAVKPRPPPPIQTSVPVASSSTTATTATVLPKIDRRGEQLHNTNNNSSSDIINNSSLAMAISPQARVLPPSLPLPFRRSSFSNGDLKLSTLVRRLRPRAARSSRVRRSLKPHGARREELDGTVALSTTMPRNRHEEESGPMLATPARLQSVEESLRATSERYRIDLDALLADNQRFLDITTTANQHLESIHDELPQISTTYDKTTSALVDLSKDIATLHVQQELLKGKMLEQLDQVFNQGTDEKLALVEAHEAEKALLRDAHTQELQDLDVQYRAQLEALEQKYNDMETTCLKEIRELQASSAAELVAMRDQAATELAQLKESSYAEKDPMEDALQLQIRTLQVKKVSELEELRCSSSAAYEALRAKSESEFNEVEQSSKARYDNLERTSNETLDAVRAKAAFEFVVAMNQLKRELEALQQSRESELAHLRAEYLDERTRLVQESTDATVKLKQEHEDRVTRLETQRMEETTALQSALETLHDTLTLEIQTLKQQHVNESEAMRVDTEQTVRALKSAHASRLHEMEAATSLKLSETIASYEATFSSTSVQHAAELLRVNEDNAASQAALISKHETELTELRDESKREKDLVVLTYETKLEELTKANKAQLESTLKAHDATAAQLRDTHNASVLRLEATLREQEAKFIDTVSIHETEITRRDAELQDLQTRLDALTTTHEQHVDLSKQLVTRKDMEMCEHEARMLSVQQELAYQLEILETMRKELTAASDDRVVKANTVLELAFMIKSRDDEIERLRNALLDSIQSVNQKTEILELTAESLSTKAKELEDTKAALRKESGRLSRIESMRLNMDNLRLEMKRMQMDMTLQLQHTEGEMALKNGEISRLYAAQSELKQKNDFHRRTIDRLEDTLSRTQRQCDDAERRITLLRLETTQYADESQKTHDELLAKEQELLTLTNDKHILNQDMQRVQIQLSNAHFRKLNEVEDPKNEVMRDREAALEALKTIYAEQLQTVKQDREALARDFEAKLALADTTARVLVQEHKDEVAAMESAHAAQLEARTKEAETATALLKQECDDKIRALTEKLQRDAELSRLRVAEEHLRKLEQVVENARVNEQQQRRALDDVQAAFTEKTQRLDVATQQLTLCEGQIGELQRKVETSEQELRDAKQLIIARTSTIYSLHKELAELHEATEVTSSEVSAEECLTRLRQQLDAHLWTRYRLDRAQISGLMYSTEADALECLQQFVRIRCARLTRDDGEEKGEGDEKKNETHLDAALVLSVDDVCKRVRDYDDLYATKTDYDAVASTHHELLKNDSWSAVNEKVSTEVTRILTEFNQLTQCIEELFHLDPSSDGSAKSRHTASSLAPKLENYAALLAKLGLIDDENPHARAGQILEILAQHDALPQHAATMWNAETLQLTNLQDIGALLTQVHDVLEFSRGAVKNGLGECNTIADLKVLVAELTHLWMTYDMYTTMYDAKPSHLEPRAGDSDGTVDSHVPVAAKSAEILRFVDNTTRFIAYCQAMLHLNPSSKQALSLDPSTCSTDEILQQIRANLRSMDDSTHFVANCRAALRLDLNKEVSPPASSSTDEILQCIQELMTVLDHFDALQSLPMASINSDGVGDTSAHFLTADNGSALASIQRKVGIVRTFLDELHLMTDFAQSILDEESDATASTDALGNASTNTSNSNSSSRESLQGFRALTRTPTPMSMDLDDDNEDDVKPTNLEIDVPRPLNELELELLQQDGDMASGFAPNVEFPGQDDDDLIAEALTVKPNGKAPPPSSPLADSLVDISLVMNDHHRILSEAAHWVHKTARLRRRSLSSQVQQKQPQPRDLGSEICRLVREHCVVLSLAKKLFKLKDPRHDLSTLLECLAILKRLTTRLPVFQQDGNYHQGHAIPPSGLSESLLRSNSSVTSSTSSLAGAASSHTGGNRHNASLQSSLSIFACIEDIARHLQDYDFFLQQMQTNRGKQWLPDHSSSTGTMGFAPNIEIVTRDVSVRLELLATTVQSLGLQDPSIELPQLCERIQTLVARCMSLDPWKTSESSDNLHHEAEPNDTKPDNEAMEMMDSESMSQLRITPDGTTQSYATCLDDIERDLAAYTTFIEWLRRALPFAQSVESVDDLQIRTQSILDQLERFANENVELREQLAAYHAEEEQQQAQEDAFLAAHGVNVIMPDFAALGESKNDDSGASSQRTSSRIAIFEQLLDERQRLATKSNDIDANMSLEAALLVAHGLLSTLADDSTALEPSDEQTGHERRLGEQTTAHQQLEMANKDVRLALEEQQQSSCERVNAVTASLHDLQSRLTACVSNENAFLQAHGVVLSLPLGEIGGDAKDTTTLVADRIPVYEHFVAATARLEAIQQQVRDELTAEQCVLERYGLLCASEDAEKTEVTAEVTASGNTTTTDSEEQGVFDATSLRLSPHHRQSHSRLVSRSEKAFLAAHSLELDAGNATSSRMDVHKTLLDGQNALIDEKMECEVDLERENAFLARNGLPVADRMALFDDMVGLRLELDARDEMDAMEQSFLKEHGLWMPEADEKEEEGTTIGTKMDPQERFGMRFRAFTELIEARAMQEQERQLRQAAIEAEKAYLVQQTFVNLGDAIDLEVPGFSRLRVFEALVDALVRAEEESHQHQFSHTRSAGQSGISPTQARALLLDKFTKRDTAAISMIYRSIRLATDILNTSAFVGGGSTAAEPGTSMMTAHASEIPVEVTQSVLNCVKELKVLKEYLIESLEQLTRSDDVFPSQPPAFVKLNIADALTSSASSAEDQRDKNEASIDFALCSHREFMNYAHLQLLMREEAMHATFAKLMNSLQGIARGDEGDSNNSNSTGSEAFAVSQQKLMRLEMDVVRESETRQNLDCKFHLNETYYHRLLDERKEVEVTLNNALADLRAECRSLRAKVDALEHERYTAPPPSSASSVGLYGLMSSPSPRATPMMSVNNSSNFGFPVMPMRPEKPRDEGPSKPGGSIHKERFVSSLEKETGQRRSGATHNPMSARRIREWKKQDELQLSSSSHLEHEFRALQAAALTATSLVPVAEAPASLTLTRGGGTATGPRGGVGPNPHDQELWYQGVRSVQDISFFVSVFHVPKQNLFRVEVFNSDMEQQQTIYVRWSELEAFLSESKKARNLGLSLHDATKRSEIADVLSERVRVYGEGTANILLGFE
ncbi:hypothetical protein FI667_g15250, partial [Globisporangium splendens]